MESFQNWTWFLCLASLLSWNTGRAELVNVALGKPTAQTDDWNSDGVSSNAVDGNHDPIWHRSFSCTGTATYDDAYWVVDLLGSYPVQSIKITNRDYLEDRLQNFTIYVSDESPLPIPSPDGTFKGRVCLHHLSILPPNGPHSLLCDQVVTGRYVYVWRPDGDYLPNQSILTLCEFEVLVEKSVIDQTIPRSEFFSIFPQQKSSTIPFYTSNLLAMRRSPTPSFCLHVCLLSPEGYVTVVQLNHVTGECQCLEESPLSVSATDIEVDGDWALIKSKGNL